MKTTSLSPTAITAARPCPRTWPSWKVAALLALVVWASCRFYYFLFHVPERYVDPAMRYAGLLDILRGMRKRGARQGQDSPVVR